MFIYWWNISKQGAAHKVTLQILQMYLLRCSFARVLQILHLRNLDSSGMCVPTSAFLSSSGTVVAPPFLDLNTGAIVDEILCMH